MSSIGCRRFFLLLSAALSLLAGCGPGGSAPSPPPAAGSGSDLAASSGDLASISEADAEGMIGEYMPTQEGGTLDIAPPKGWDYSRAGSDYLVGFHPANASLNDLPRILVSAEATPFAGIEDLDEGNAKEFVRMLTAALGDEQLRASPTAVTLGGRTWAQYVAFRKSRNSLVARQILQTVVRGRQYKIHLEVFDRELPQYRAAAFAVAASARFKEGSSEGSSDPLESNAGP